MNKILIIAAFILCFSINVFAVASVVEYKEKNLVLATWDFYYGELTDFKDMELEKSNKIDISKEWIKLGYPGNGVASYRKRIKNLKKGNRYGLFLPPSSSAMRVILNGKIYSEIGEVGTIKEEESPKKITTAIYFVAESEEVEIVIQMSNYHFLSGGLKKPLVFGNDENISQLLEKNKVMHYLILGVFLIFMLYHICLFFFRKLEIASLAFAGLCISGMLYRFSSFHYEMNLFPVLLKAKIEYLSILLNVSLFIVFFSIIFSEEFNKRLVGVFLSYSILLGLTAVFLPKELFNEYQKQKIFLFVFVFSSQIFLFINIIRAIFKKREGAKFLVFGFLALVLFFINDLLYARGVSKIGPLAPFGAIAMLFAQSLVLAKKFTNALYSAEELAHENRNMYLEIKDLNTNLEVKIEDRTKEIQDQKLVLEELNTELKGNNTKIKNSIEYAKRIQSALLPKNSDLEELFQNIFIIDRAKDIVSGDFFWHTTIGDNIIIVQADCTGHGVPGAFISIVGSVILDKNIKENRLLDPSVILENIDIQLKKMLKQESKYQSDGMDVAICIINKEKDSLKYAGAKRPILYFDKISNTLEELKGTRRSIGEKKKKHKREFENKEVKLSRVKYLYMFSDGYPDQLNMDRQSFSLRQMKEVLQKNNDIDINEQRQLLLDLYNDHKKEMEQIDDITILGIEI